MYPPSQLHKIPDPSTMISPKGYDKRYLGPLMNYHRSTEKSSLLPLYERRFSAPRFDDMIMGGEPSLLQVLKLLVCFLSVLALLVVIVSIFAESSLS
ncbi:hypothetical protein GQ602_006805 [Ophiocordyceps camponoti-floridani]|uniref:Uncharacterized protein n=1 Tax=Ophiocordyceps camponoti-floridani TaxID=2030778 RepID=A0A8H4VB95_9HYPO|nr:hypothetical protein GQ602_006805 [Ophiocordyceps camponoti-floridani]